MERWRGLKSLVQDAVEHGSRRVERVQKELARRPFAVLEQIPAIAVPVKGIHEVHDLVVSSTHDVIRLVNRVVGDSLDVVMETVERQRHDEPPKRHGME
ncbi:hypothetical protein [Chondromyces crocatus]|uniref:Uncharacterized protein n=1 Tax=Chondromyces crocatus TaxID=52 RepID=A0A0K1ER16_CHOCO|nr:hypothetical protein [Chondromyces crocatus]AKT43082.1 uncharacterized protein CMC5_073100 [Chondromyces crocatus]